jgi:hypothetical protein
MNFGKIALGTLLVAVGVLLVAVNAGFAHPDTPIFLLRYWPLLLIAFGLAFLAGAIKNPFLGCFAIFLILGGTALGVWWMNRKENARKVAPAVSSLDLASAHVSSLLVRVTTFAGNLDLGAAPLGSRSVSVALRGVSGDKASGYRLDVTGARAVLEWPRGGGSLGLAPPGTKVEVRAPSGLPVALRWSGRIASLHADLARLRPMQISLHEICSAGRLTFDDSGRPEEIRVWGVASNLRVRIPADCPVRLISQGSLVLRTLPSDFEEHATGLRGKDRIDAAEGRGPTVRIYVGGPFMGIQIERMPLVALSPQPVDSSAVKAAVKARAAVKESTHVAKVKSSPHPRRTKHGHGQ